MWVFKCECGKKKPIRSSSVITGHTKSCGCLRLDNALAHGKSKTPEYKAWYNMKRRCYNPGLRHSCYDGVEVCDRWMRSFENFYKDMGDKPSDKHSLDRIDTNGNYEPSNCRWATAKEQVRNRNITKYFYHNGAMVTISDLSYTCGIKQNVLRARIVDLGWSIERAITTRVSSGSTS